MMLGSSCTYCTIRLLNDSMILLLQESGQYVDENWIRKAGHVIKVFQGNLSKMKKFITLT
jgi:hypothetical protein